MLDLLAGVFHEKLELLVPHRRPVAAGMAGGVLLAAPEGLRADLDPAVRVALPGEAPHRQVPGLQQGDLYACNPSGTGGMPAAC